MPKWLENKDENEAEITEYAVIGAGPAALCAITNILNSGVSGDDIVWIDPQFKVGDFGTTLSVGSSVPGNTTVESYQKVNKEIYKMLPGCAPKKGQIFEIDSLSPSFVCSLKVAAVPLQHITNELRKIVHSEEGTVSNIFTTVDGLKLKVILANGKLRHLTTKRALLATGAQPRTLQLPPEHSQITMIHPNITFIQSELAKYLRKNTNIESVAVIGSSHSAALATMHLLQAGLIVKQFMNKEYRYAVPCIVPNGTKYTMYDNTGLKGDVAKFTKKLLEDITSDKNKYKDKLTRYIGRDRQEVTLLLEKHLVGCSHAVATIGYETSCTLLVDNTPASRLIHDNKTTVFNGIKGLFGIGVAFPQTITALSGEVEFAVGVEKFWSTASNPSVLDIWQRNPAS